MVLYPIFLNLTGRPVLIVGGGRVGLRKAQGLLDAQAEVHVMSRVFDAGFDRLNVTRYVGEFDAALVRRVPRWRLVFAATDDSAINESVGREAAQLGILCARCDEPDAGDFSGGAVKIAEPVVLGVSTSGGAPGLAARLRDAAAEALDPVLVAWAQKSAVWRGIVRQKVRDPQRRRALLQRLAGPEMEQALRDEPAPAAWRAEELFEQWLAAAVDQTEPPASAI